MGMNVNANAYGGYYTSNGFYQKKEAVKNKEEVASAIGNDEMEAVLKEKDPELLEQLKGVTSKMWNKESVSGASSIIKKAMDYVYEARKEMGVDFSKTNDISANNEEKLSKKAQDYLKNLREKYGDYDFMIGNGSDEIRALSKTGSKEFSVILSNEEIERMANDEDYAAKKLHEVENSVNMCRKICEQQGYESSFGTGNGTINKITIASDDNGNMKFFAELEKTSEKQKERLEKSREKKADDKKAEERRAHKKNPYEKEKKDTVKRTTIEANSINELMDKIEHIDWADIADSKSGDRFNFSV